VKAEAPTSQGGKRTGKEPTAEVRKRGVGGCKTVEKGGKIALKGENLEHQRNEETKYKIK